jgi:hypothetical protein
MSFLFLRKKSINHMKSDLEGFIKEPLDVMLQKIILTLAS